MVALLRNEREKFIWKTRQMPASVEMNRRTAKCLMSQLADGEEEQSRLMKLVEKGEITIFNMRVVIDDDAYDYGHFRLKVG